MNNNVRAFMQILVLVIGAIVFIRVEIVGNSRTHKHNIFKILVKGRVDKYNECRFSQYLYFKDDTFTAGLTENIKLSNIRIYCKNRIDNNLIVESMYVVLDKRSNYEK